MTSIGFEAMTGLMPYGPVGNCTIRDFVYLYIMYVARALSSHMWHYANSISIGN